MTTRQEIYDRIRQTSKNEVILEDMIRLGFWPSAKEMPEGPAAEIRRMEELKRELRKLTSENRQLKNVESIKRQQRKARLVESKKKRLENKEKKLKERKERANDWARKQQKEIVFVGLRHSAGLSHHEADLQKLGRVGLQHLTNAEELARAMNIPLGRLRFLAFGRKTSSVTHYRRFAIKKKTGGVRMISAPMPRLKRAQRWILDTVLQPYELNDAAHGFRKDRSIVSNAQPHVGAQVVLNMDMQEFFPTVRYPRVKGLFRSLGFSESLATILGMVCTESDVAELELDQQRYYVARGERYLPQGAPTSPAITNLICRGLDARLTKVASQLGFTYTRYADDITFSSRDSSVDVGRAIRRIKHSVRDEGFLIHPDKTRVLRSGRRMEVTGLTVNDKVGVSRKELRRFRAVLFQIERDGPANKSWGKTGDVMASISGFANFVAMVDPEKGRSLQQQVGRIIEKHGCNQPKYTMRHRWENTEIFVSAAHLPLDEVKPLPPRKESQEDKPWWKFW